MTKVPGRPVVLVYSNFRALTFTFIHLADTFILSDLQLRNAIDECIVLVPVLVIKISRQFSEQILARLKCCCYAQNTDAVTHCWLSRDNANNDPKELLRAEILITSFL